MRVALMNGCAQKALDPKINEATIRLLNRIGVEVVVAKGAGCCGALTHHMGKVDASHASAAANIRAWVSEMNRNGLDHVVINTSGCGTTVKDYGFMFREDTKLAADAATIAGIACDITELLEKLAPKRAMDLPPLRVAYHSACSMQHGQKLTTLPMTLLSGLGFETLPVPESHICCGSAGTYNLLQPELAGQLQARKVANIESISPDVIAAGNLGCMIQIGSATETPVVHTVELIDWATGGPVPLALQHFPKAARQAQDYIIEPAA
jgi:glycolate oxidase iron-sulfur subunit